jgi:hypothetical protein
MTLYYYMYRNWQDCCRRGENRSWPSVSVESVDSEYWCLNSAFVYAFIMWLTVEERVLRSTFKLNTLYNIVPYSTMICFGVGLSQQFAEKAAVYCFLARACTSHSPSYREKDSGLKTTGVTPFAIFTKPFITQQFSPPLAPKRRSTWT